jgi:hypothetical protein
LLQTRGLVQVTLERKVVEKGREETKSIQEEAKRLEKEKRRTAKRNDGMGGSPFTV